MNNGSDATNKFHLSLSLYIYSPWQHAVPLGFGHVHNKLVPTVNKLKGFRFGGTTYNDIYIYLTCPHTLPFHGLSEIALG